MSERMTSEEVDAIEALVEAATPGPWAEHDEAERPLEVRGADYGRYPHPIAICGGFRCEADATFIAAAREDVPRLCAAWREASAERDAAIARAERAEADAKHLRAHLQALAEDVERALAYRETTSKGGQLVARAPVLSNAPPSLLVHLRDALRRAVEP